MLVRTKVLGIALAVLAAGCAVAQTEEPLPRRPAMGAMLRAVSPEVDEKFDSVVAGSPEVVGVLPGGTAESLGLKPGDVFLQVGTTKTANIGAIGQGLAGKKVGDVLEVVVLRAGEELKLQGTLREAARDSGDYFEAIYDHVTSKGDRLRLIVTKPKKEGRHPAFFFIQGLQVSSVDQPLSTQQPHTVVIDGFARAGWVTVRLEKRGVGDSEGGPGLQVGFDDESDGYLRALEKIKTYDFVDPEKIVLFGHSMGGVHAPIIAAENKVAGVMAYGTVTMPLIEYMLENSRRQAMLSGGDMTEFDATQRPFLRAMMALFDRGLTIEDLAKEDQDLASFARQVFANNMLSGRTLGFWQELSKRELANVWANVDAKVAAMWSIGDFLAPEGDHHAIAAIVNGRRPGTAEFMRIEGMDHGFFTVSSMPESYQKWFQGGQTINPEIVKITVDWAQRVVNE